MAIGLEAPDLFTTDTFDNPGSVPIAKELQPWDDIKSATMNCTKLYMIAFVGEKRWEEWMAKVFILFTFARIQYFDLAEIDAAKTWLAEA